MQNINVLFTKDIKVKQGVTYKLKIFFCEKEMPAGEENNYKCRSVPYHVINSVITCFFHDFVLGFASYSIMKKTCNNLHIIAVVTREDS